MKRLRGEVAGFILISLLFLLFFVFFQSSSIFGGDAGDLVTAAYLRGVAHPPGYPLYTFFGWLLTLLPFQTVAWRVGLLSSISGSLVIGMLFLTCRRLTKDTLSSLLAVTTLGFTYLFWLYAIVPEVFALHALFSIGLFYLGLLIHEEKSQPRLKRLLLVFFFILGLSLTHHHTILFLFPVFGYLLWPKIKSVFIHPKQLLLLGLVFSLGLLPYLYVFWAAQANPAINWEDPKTIAGFFRLVTRAIYGTFRSGSWLEQNNADRFAQLRLYFDTIIIDYSRLGLLLMVGGIYWMFKKSRKYFAVTIIAFFCIGPLFIFYSGFPYLLNFYLGTVERFFLVSYLFLTVFLAFGISGLSFYVSLLLRKVTGKSWNSLSKIVILILPLSLLLTTFPKIAPLKNDRTAENLAYDVLKTVPDNSVLLLAEDTVLFNTLYVYYTTGGELHNRGIKLIMPGIMNLAYYLKWVQRNYPGIEFPSTYSDSTFWTEFALKNIEKMPIYSSNPLLIDKKFYWAQYGVVKRLIRKGLPQSAQKYVDENEKLFNSYQNLDKTVLSTYTHTMLADTARVYTTGRVQVASQLTELGLYKEAETYLKEASPYEVIDRAIILDKLSSIYALQNRCIEAEQVLDSLFGLLLNKTDTLTKKIKLYRECFKNENETNKLEQQLEVLQKDSKSSLKNF